MPDIAGCELGAHVLAGFKEGGLAVKGMGGGELGAHALAGFEDLDLAVVVMSGRELGAYVLALFKEADLAALGSDITTAHAFASGGSESGLAHRVSRLKCLTP